MKNNGSSNSNLKTLVVIISIVIIALPFGYSLANFVFSKSVPSDKPFLERPDAKHEKCVKDTEYMRFYHMDLLKQVRNEFVRDGKRGDIGLYTCKECHTSRANFCTKCHHAVSLYPDCYGCHYYP